MGEGFNWSSIIAPSITAVAGGLGAAATGRATAAQLAESRRQFDIAQQLAIQQQAQQELVERQKFETLLNGLVNQGVQSKMQAEQAALSAIPALKMQQSATLGANMNQGAAANQSAYQTLIAALQGPAMRR